MIAVINAVRSFVLMLRDAFRELRQHEPLQIAAAASFFAVFALPPILIILVEMFSIFGSPWSISEGLLQQLSLSIDKNTIMEVSKTVRNVQWLPLGYIMQAIGFLFLLFVATTFFAVVKSSLNQLWSIRPKKNKSMYFMLLQRAKSLGVIVFAGILVLIIMAVEAEGTILYASAMLASMAWFIVVFRFLADGRPEWKASVAGGAFAGLLFTIGKSVLRLLLSYSTVHTIYGASTAMVLLLLFVFYSSLIFYYSACFVKVFSDRENKPVRPTSHAIKFMVKRAGRYEENESPLP